MARRLAAALVVLGSSALRQPPRRIAAEKTLRVLIADVGGCVEIVDATSCPRDCVCSMAWRFHAINATSSP